MLELDIAQPCVESRYNVCRIPLSGVGRIPLSRVPNPVVLFGRIFWFARQMPHLRLAGRLPPIDIDKIAGLFNLPLLDVAIVVKDFQPTVSLAKNSLVYFISIVYIAYPVWRGHRDAAKRGPPCGPRITRNEGARVPLLLPCAAPGWSPIAAWCGSGGHPSGAAVAPSLHAAARTRRAARAVQGDVVSVWQVLPGTPSAPPIPAQRVARFDDHCTRNCLLQNKLRQRYSRSREGQLQTPPRDPLRQCIIKEAVFLAVE